MDEKQFNKRWKELEKEVYKSFDRFLKELREEFHDKAEKNIPHEAEIKITIISTTGEENERDGEGDQEN